jgi:hypothetical protein
VSTPPVILDGLSERSLALLDTDKVKLLVPFIVGTHTVRQAGKLCGVTPKRMLYWVNRFLAHGLIVQANPDPVTQAARYRAVSPAFTVTNLDVYVIEQHIEQQFGPLWNDFKAGLKRMAKQEAVTWDLHVSLDDQGTVVRRFVPSDLSVDHPLTTNVRELNTWAHLPLSRQEVRQLRLELDALMERYVRLAQTPRSTEQSLMLIHLGMIPVNGPE